MCCLYTQRERDRANDLQTIVMAFDVYDGIRFLLFNDDDDAT